MDDQQLEQTGNDYWPSVGMVSAVFGFVVFVISLITMYITINAEPTGSIFSPVQFIGIIACLVGAFGGMGTIWHYANTEDISLKLGRGALIGFLTGVGIAVVSAVLMEIWHFIDPDMTEKMIESTIANLEAMDLPDEQKQTMIDSAVDSMESQQSFGYKLLWNIPLYGILNLLTGMIGVKLFAPEEG